MTEKYTIKDLAQITRIKPHTLRIWEQRYGIIKPQRTEINTRLYCQEDLKYLLNISILYNEGEKISKIAKLSKEELSKKVKSYSIQNLEYETQIQAFVIAMVEFNELGFEEQLNSNISTFGMEDTIINIIYPFMRQIGVLWQTNSINPAQEHFITNLVRQKLIVAIDSIPLSNQIIGFKTILLYLPEGELHEIGLLFASYVIKKNGHKCIYLGQSLPMIDLKNVIKTSKPNVILTIITSSPCQEEVQPYIDKLEVNFPETVFWITGFQIVSQNIRLPKKFVMIKSPGDIKVMLSSDI